MYAKIFTSIWDGSLYGKLEASAVMMACVTLCNAEGVLDMTPEAISGRTGWPLEFIKEGIRQLEQPDPRSRTADEEGRRFVRLDQHRDWGWLIVNYEKYRSTKDLDTIREQTKARVAKLRDKKRAVTHGYAKQKQKQKQKQKEIRKPLRVAQGFQGDRSAVPRIFSLTWLSLSPNFPTSTRIGRLRSFATGNSKRLASIGPPAGARGFAAPRIEGSIPANPNTER